MKSNIKKKISKFWFSFIILVKKNNKNGHLGHIWPMYYRKTCHFLHGGPICPSQNNTKNRMTVNQPICLCLSLPAPTANVQTLTTSMLATSRLPNGWEKTRPSDGYTAKPVAHASVNGKVHLCRTPSYPASMLYALSNVSATAAPLKRPQTSAKSIPAPCSGYWKGQVNVQPISTAYNLKISMSRSKRCRWMNCTAKPSKAKKTASWLMFPKNCVNALVKKGQNLASYGSGSKREISSRIYYWSKNTRNCLAIDCFGGCVFEGQRPSTDSYRRPFAISTGYLAGIWRDQTLPSQKWQRQIQVSPSQTACGFAGGRSKETSRQKRQFVEGIEQSIVWQKEGNHKTNSRPVYWSKDQHIPYGTAQWHDKGTAGSSYPTYPQRLSSGGNAAIFDMVVAGLVQLDKGALFVVGRNTCDGVWADQRSMDCFEVYFLSGSCQRLTTSRLGRAA